MLGNRAQRAIAIAVVELDGCYLVGQRPAGVPLAGLWEFPGGKVEPGETPQAAVIRECREEAAVDVQITAAYDPIDHEYEHGRVRLHFFACVPVDTAPTPKTPFQWVPVAKLTELAFPAANAAIIEQLISKS